MGLLRVSVFSLSFLLATHAFGQAEATDYQCAPNGSLNGGLLIVQTDRIQIFAKHKDGIVSELSGITGYRNARLLHPKYTKNIESTTYARLNVLGMSVSEYLANTGYSDYQKGIEGAASEDPASSSSEQEAPDRDDIDQGAYPPIATNTDPNARPGDKVPPKAGDRVTATSAGARMPPRNPVPRKNGDLVSNESIVSFSARLNQQGDISELSYRDGQRPITYIRIDANNPSSDEVYRSLNEKLSGIKAQALCCTNNPGAACTTSHRAPAKSTLRSVKATLPQTPGANESNSANPAHRAAGAQAK